MLAQPRPAHLLRVQVLGRPVEPPVPAEAPVAVAHVERMRWAMTWQDSGPLPYVPSVLFASCGITFQTVALLIGFFSA
jgi:hypothetical protein